MVKEEVTDAAATRKKPVADVSAASKDADMYKTITTFEEKEATDRSSEEDSDSFLVTCDNIRKAMNDIAQLKAKNDPEAKEEIREIQIETSLAFIELKKLNRMEKFRTKFARDSLIAAKSSVDSRHLQLQNLLYEVMHLKKEVVKCLQFKSKDELIDLVPTEDFYNDAPESISKPEVTKEDPHQLRLARLTWELTQRKELSVQCDELTENKKIVAASIDVKQSRLDNLAPQLRVILEASKPLQESLGLPLDKIKEEHSKAAQLPSPLYVLYAKMSAYRDACDSGLTITVEGDEDEAKRVNNQEITPESDSESETQLDNANEDPPAHKKRHHRVSKEARQEEKKSRLVQRHPLSIKVIITFDEKTKLTLKFFYLTVLKVVTVESKLDSSNVRGVSAGDMLVSETVLRELYPGDSGAESPNAANHYQLSKQKLGPFSSLGLGVPYKWAQRMAGLLFIPSNATEQLEVDQNLAQDSVENVLKEIKKRVKARLELCEEIVQLESGNVEIPSGFADVVPQKVSTSLHKFVPSSWKNFNNGIEAPDSMQNILANVVDIFYEAVLRRDKHDLLAYIAIKPDYPKVTPVFRIVMKSSTSISTNALRDIEREVNVMWKTPPTLSVQIQRLRACFDIYLETEGLVSKQNVYFEPVKGKTRARPYKFVSKGGGIFTHR